MNLDILCQGNLKKETISYQQPIDRGENLSLETDFLLIFLKIDTNPSTVENNKIKYLFEIFTDVNTPNERKLSQTKKRQKNRRYLA